MSFELKVEENTETKEMTFIFSVTEIPSVNSLYEINYAKRRKFRAPLTVKIAQELSNQLDKGWVETYEDWFGMEEHVSMTTQVVMNHGFRKRDLDNTLKLIQDTVTRYFEFDDHLINELHAFKSEWTDIPTELIIVKLAISKFDSSYFSNGDT